jgi:hypothetical protein
MDRVKVKHATASVDWSIVTTATFEVISSRPEKHYSKSYFGEEKQQLIRYLEPAVHLRRETVSRISSLSPIHIRSDGIQTWQLNWLCR